jgi:hypothetical protein
MRHGIPVDDQSGGGTDRESLLVNSKAPGVYCSRVNVQTFSQYERWLGMEMMHQIQTLQMEMASLPPLGWRAVLQSIHPCLGWYGYRTLYQTARTARGTVLQQASIHSADVLKHRSQVDGLSCRGRLNELQRSTCTAQALCACACACASRCSSSGAALVQ